jgi:hypothetical protein
MNMGAIRTTVLLDEVLARRVRQFAGGNLSKGINELLHAHLSENSAGAGFGSLKGKVSAKDIVRDDSDGH